MLIPDLLHVWNLGVAREMLGSALKVILKTRDVFGAAALEDRRAQATASLRGHAAALKAHLRFKKISKARIGWSNEVYPSLVCSGYDAYIVGQWLETILVGKERFSDIYTMVWASNRALSTMYNANRFLTPQDKATIRLYGNLFLTTYMRVASEALQGRNMLFKILPKMHLLTHVWNWDHRNINASYYSTWLDEDSSKRLGKHLVSQASHMHRRGSFSDGSWPSHGTSWNKSMV